MAPGPPTKADIYSFTRPFLHFWFPCLIFYFFLPLLAVGQNCAVYGEQVDRIQRAARPVPRDTQICTLGLSARDPALLKRRGGEEV